MVKRTRAASVASTVHTDSLASTSTSQDNEYMDETDHARPSTRRRTNNGRPKASSSTSAASEPFDAGLAVSFPLHASLHRLNLKLTQFATSVSFALFHPCRRPKVTSQVAAQGTKSHLSPAQSRPQEERIARTSRSLGRSRDSCFCSTSRQ